MAQQFVQLLVNGLITGSILALTGVGASLVFGIQRIANFAHGDYLTIGAYVPFVVTVVFHQNLVVAPPTALFLARTRLGKSMRAVADNRTLAAVSGIDVERMAVYVWILAGGLAGLGGVMLALVQGPFEPNLGVGPLFLIFTTVVLGGIGSAFGALTAGLALGLAMELSTWSGLLGGVEPKYKPILAFIVLILLLLYRPQGLFGRARVL